MRLTHVRVAILLLALIVNGCGGKKADESQTGTAVPASPAVDTSSAAVAAVSKYDAGPRAGESPVDEALAKQGEGLFQTKGCVACHGFGKRVICPDMSPVAMQRTAQWMEAQILHPEVMTRQDPIAHDLLKQYSRQMPNQGLTQAQARAVIEFIKRKGREAGGATK